MVKEEKLSAILNKSLSLNVSEPGHTQRKRNSSKSSTSSSISTREIKLIVERLKSQHHRDSTRKLYHQVWKQFSSFYLRLDVKPATWEDRITLFTAYLINNKLKSTTIRSYISALKSVLHEDGRKINKDSLTISALMRACKIRNDKPVFRFPIYKQLLKLIIDELCTWSAEEKQHYLFNLYAALFMAAYYGLLRVGELTRSPHTLAVNDVHIGINKKKILFVL